MVWDLEALRQAPAVVWGERSGPQRALQYDGVFAYYAVPEGRRERVPAIVLVHGGGGRAFPQWATMWAQRGYAALAMDLSRCGPGMSDRGAFYAVAEGVEESWVHPAVAAVIRGVSFLRAQPEVDGERVGITGISWGGYLTCIVAGLDDRLRVAMPVYGCGFLHENSVWKPMLDGMPAALRARWVSAFEPSMYLGRAAMPMLWISGTNDANYPLDSLGRSYRLPSGPRVLRITVNMPHGHAAGWEPVELCAFADQHLRGGTPLPQVGPVERDGAGLVRARLQSEVPVVGAALHHTADGIAWPHRRWQTVAAAVGDGFVEARLPGERPLAHFMTVTDLRGLVVSTDFEVAAG